MALSHVFNKQPFRVIDGVYDFLKVHDDYVENYNQIAKDDSKERIMPDEVKEVILNCCELLLPHSSESRTVVDVGAAYGFILSKINAKQKIAIDISIDYLLQIPSRYIIRIRANAEDIPLEDHIADTVICTDVFEHVQNENAMASELERILKPGGKLFLATPWEQDLSVYETEEYLTKYKKYEYVHLRSIDDTVIQNCFPAFEMLSSTLITIGMKHMTIKPYSIRFMQLVKEKSY